MRAATFEDAQNLLMDMVDPTARETPEIRLELSSEDGPEWTDVRLDGRVVVQIPTRVLAPNSRRTGGFG